MLITPFFTKKKQVRAIAKAPYPAFVTSIDVTYCPPGSGKVEPIPVTIPNNTGPTLTKFLPGTPIYDMTINMTFSGYSNGFVRSIGLIGPDGKKQTMTLQTALPINSNGICAFPITTIAGNRNPDGSLFNISDIQNNTLEFNVSTTLTSPTKTFSLTKLNLPLYPNLISTTKLPKKTFGTSIGSTDFSFTLPAGDTSSVVSIIDPLTNLRVTPPIVVTGNSKVRTFKYTKTIGTYTPANINNTIIFATSETTFYSGTYTIPSTNTNLIQLEDTTANYNTNSSNGETQYNLSMSFRVPSSIINVSSSSNYNLSTNQTYSSIDRGVSNDVRIQENISLDGVPSSMNGVCVFNTTKGNFWGKWTYVPRD